MKKTIKFEIGKSCDDYCNLSRQEWALKWPGQCVRFHEIDLRSYLTVLFDCPQLGAKCVNHELDHGHDEYIG